METTNVIAAIAQIGIAAAFLAAASVQTPKPTAYAFPAEPLAPVAGAHCPDGGGRAIGDPIGHGAYIRQELQLATRGRDQRVVGYVYSASDGGDYIDLTPSVSGEHVRPLATGDLPRPNAMMRYCFNGPYTRAWGRTR